MKYLSLFLITAIPGIQGFAQVAKSTVDFTKIDITATRKFSAKAVTIFGVSLGMNKKRATDSLTLDSRILWEFDTYNTPSEDVNSLKETRIYVYEKDIATGKKGNSLLYLIWNNGSVALNRIVFFKDMQPLAVGDTRNLFSTDAVTTTSEFYKRFLVRSDKQLNERYTIKDNYVSKQIQVIQLRNEGKPNDIYFSLESNLK